MTMEYVKPASPRGVILPITIAFLVDTLAHMQSSPHAENAKQQVPAYDHTSFLQSFFGRNFPAYIVLTGILVLMFDIDTTRDLAVAFAWLIAIAALLANGADAINIIHNQDFIPNIKETPLSFLVKQNPPPKKGQ